MLIPLTRGCEVWCLLPNTSKNSVFCQSELCYNLLMKVKLVRASIVLTLLAALAVFVVKSPMFYEIKYPQDHRPEFPQNIV